MRGTWLLALLLVLSSAGACGGDEQTGGSYSPFKVLTWNLYLGADLFPLVAVTTPAGIPDVAAGMWAKVQATDFPARAKIIAARIAELAPDLVALQEVTNYRRQAPSDYQSGDPPNATGDALDFLRLVTDELAARGAVYHVVEEAENADIELPVSDGAGGLFDLRVTDRDVILAADGVTTADPLQQKFRAKLNFTVGGVGGVPMSFTRSESHVTVHGLSSSFTFANSHLEVGSLIAVQDAQAKELAAFMAALVDPVVLIGDFNSPPGQPTYKLLTNTFRDLAAGRPPPATDATCCQAGDLKNPTSMAGSRIDLVLTRGSVRMNSALPVGADPAKDRTPSGLWASDHFGVFAALELR